MVPRPTALAPRWYRSLYFRIGFSFVLFAVSVIVAQSALFNYALSRGPYQIRPPNILATMIAADVSSALTQEPALDLKQYLTEGYARAQPIYVLMKGGDVTGNRPAPLSGSLRGVAEAALEGTGFRRLGEDLGTTPATVMAPIQVDGQLRGMVVLPPAPPPNPILRDVGRLLTVQGTALLVVATVLAAAFIFAPARRRLKALQDATHRIGAGDLGVRASEAGGDEISDLAVTFNKMADDLATRDAALRAAAGLRRQMLADVSHELKTPLTAMRGYVETLRMADLTLDPVTRDRYFATLERETFRLDRIVKDLLDLARLEDGGSGIAVRVFAIGRVFELVAQRYEPACGERGIEVRIHVGSNR
jgi:signal transduction histidine kinase